MRTVSALLLALLAPIASAKWVRCDTCKPPTGVVSGLSSLPLYKGNVRFLSETKESGRFRWTWARVDPPPACTPKQLADMSDRLFGCGAKPGEPLLRTGRVRNVP